MAIKIPIQITTLERRAASEYDDVEAQCEELQTLLKLRNVKGVLHLHEYYFAERKLILVTELLGMELSNWMLEQDSFTEKKVRMIATVLIQAIKHLHGMYPLLATNSFNLTFDVRPPSLSQRP